MNTAYHYIGLDIHKRTVSFCEKTADGRTVASGSFGTGSDSLKQWASERSAPWVGGMEATLFTGYVYDELTPHAVDIQVGHPYSIKAISAAKHKSDKRDAAMLANLLRADLFPACYMASPLVRELRRVLRYRNFMVRQATALKNKTTGILMEVGVPYDAKRIHGHKYFNILVDTLTDVPNSVRGLLRTSRAGVEMFQSAQQRLLDALKKHDHLRERVELLMTIGGVGDMTALTWALEIDDVTRFSNLNKMVSYCGLCSGEIESAGKSRRAPLSKQRNPHLQTMLIEAANLAPRWNTQLAEVHARELARDNIPNHATCAVARKLVAYLRAVDRSGKAFTIRSASN